MKKIFTFVALAAVCAACNTNSPETPEEQTKAAFAKATYFEALGKNTVPNVEGENHDLPFELDSVRASVNIVSDNTLDINLYGISFSSKMPVTIDMVIPAAAFVRTAEKITVSGDNIVPLMGDKPFDRYIITGLNGYITADSLVVVNNYGSYADCVYAGKITKMEERK